MHNTLLERCALAGRFFTTSATWEALGMWWMQAMGGAGVDGCGMLAIHSEGTVICGGREGSWAS